MITYNGKYNKANVYVDIIDEATASQINGFLNHSAFEGGRIAVMPDCHAGKGSCVGFTAELGDKVIPNVVGVDIGCGMLSHRLPVRAIDCQKFDEYIRKNIPFGFSIHNTTSDNRNWLSKDEINKFKGISVRIGQREDKVLESLGTLGGGNHFIEIDKSPDGDLWVVIHSGSRNLGMATAKFHQDVAKNEVLLNGVTGIPSGLEYLEGDSAVAYLDDMREVQRYASLNRLFMMRRILNMFLIDPNDVIIGTSDCFECVHNYIDLEAGIIRKGAISAKVGERVIIPLNMRDGIIIGNGKGNENWNFSAPHGAGRILSRSKAKKILKLDEFQKTMDGVWSSCISESTLDESPMAYKPMDEIMSVIGETVEVDYVMKPIYNFKAN